MLMMARYLDPWREATIGRCSCNSYRISDRTVVGQTQSQRGFIHRLGRDRQFSCFLLLASTNPGGGRLRLEWERRSPTLMIIAIISIHHCHQRHPLLSLQLRGHPSKTNITLLYYIIGIALKAVSIMRSLLIALCSGRSILRHLNLLLEFYTTSTFYNRILRTYSHENNPITKLGIFVVSNTEINQQLLNWETEKL